MVERFLFGNELPQLYEVVVNEGPASFDEPTILSAEMIDEARSAMECDHELSREDTIQEIIKHYAESEDVAEPSYSVRMLRPAETRRRARVAVRAAMWEEVLDTPPLKQLGSTITSNMALLAQMDNVPAQNNGHAHLARS